MNFEHLTSKKLKGVLTGNPTDAQIAWAVSYTERALDSDASDEEVRHEVLDERVKRFDKAKVLFDIGLIDESLYFLKQTWSV